MADFVRVALCLSCVLCAAWLVAGETEASGAGGRLVVEDGTDDLVALLQQEVHARRRSGAVLQGRSGLLADLSKSDREVLARAEPGDDSGVNIETFLEERLGGKPFTYVVTPGNGGDALLQHGTMLLFDKLKLTFDVGYHSSAYSNTTLVTSAGGNLVQTETAEWTDVAQFLQNNAPASLGNTIILLPATIRGYAEVLGSLGSNVVIFTRERTSYDHVVDATRANASPPPVFLSRDMAFYVDELDPELPALRARAQSNCSCSTPPGARKGRGYMLRNDSESGKAPHVPAENRDVSLEVWVPYYFDSPTAYKELTRNAAHHMLQAVGNYSEVWTDRLHLCLASCFVGTKVFCMDNNYGKNKDVFFFSVQGLCPSATWAGGVAEEPWGHTAQLLACGPNESSLQATKGEDATATVLARAEPGDASDVKLLPSRISIEAFLKERLGGKPFTYIVTPGNGGDALLQHGTMLLFEKLNLTFDVGYHSSAYSNTTLVTSAASNLVQTETTEWIDVAQFLQNNSPTSLGNTIILLPATIRGYADVLGSLGSNVVIFTMERTSYDHVVDATRANASPPPVFLSRDMAFYVDLLDPELPALRARAQSNCSCSTSPGARKGRGYMLRTDSESGKAPHVPVENRDVSLEVSVPYYFESAVAYKELTRNAAHHILQAVGNYSEVWTDRLHLCLASCFLGTRVFCMDNNYGKNKDVFFFSVQDWYPSATWAGGVAEEPWNHTAQLLACGPNESSLQAAPGDDATATVRSALK